MLVLNMRVARLYNINGLKNRWDQRPNKQSRRRSYVQNMTTNSSVANLLQLTRLASAWQFTFVSSATPMERFHFILVRLRMFFCVQSLSFLFLAGFSAISLQSICTLRQSKHTEGRKDDRAGKREKRSSFGKCYLSSVAAFLALATQTGIDNRAKRLGPLSYNDDYVLQRGDKIFFISSSETLF